MLDIDKESRAKFPYGMMHADKYVAPRLALVGDACHRVHPLAGQGVNLGFGDAECLVRTIVNAVSLGADIGKTTLNTISRVDWRQLETVVEMW